MQRRKRAEGNPGWHLKFENNQKEIPLFLESLLFHSDALGLAIPINHGEMREFPRLKFIAINTVDENIPLPLPVDPSSYLRHCIVLFARTDHGASCTLFSRCVPSLRERLATSDRVSRLLAVRQTSGTTVFLKHKHRQV